MLLAWWGVHVFHDFTYLAISPAVNDGVKWRIQENEKSRDVISRQKRQSKTICSQQKHAAQIGKKTSEENNVHMKGIQGRLPFSEYPHYLTVLQLRLARYLIPMIFHNFINTDISYSCNEKAKKFKSRDRHIILIRKRNKWSRNSHNTCEPQRHQRNNNTFGGNKLMISQMKKHGEYPIYSNKNNGQEWWASQKVYRKITQS